MADQIIKLPDDTGNTGKKIDQSELTVGANTVERQRINITDPTTAAALAAVANAAPGASAYGLVTRTILTDGTNNVGVSSVGAAYVQGYQPATTASAAITAIGNYITTAVTGYNVATLTLRTFTGTGPSITFKLQASDDNTNWVDVEGTNNASGQISILWTQAAALAAGTGGPSIDYAIGGYTNIRLNVTAISGTTPSAVFGLAPQTLAYDPAVGVIAQGVVAAGSPVLGNPVRIGGSDGTNIQDLSVTVKGTQGARAIAAQDLKDSGRNQTNYFMVKPIISTSTDTLMSLTGYKGGAAVGATTTPAVVTAGKTFRIVEVILNYVAVAAAGYVVFTLRANTSGVVVIGSPAVQSWAIGVSGSTAGFSQSICVAIPDGMEFAAGTGIGVSMIGYNATGTATAVGYGMVSFHGFEY